MKRLLLHACCAPCACYVTETISSEYAASLYFYNPNISPRIEYEKRRDELFRFASDKGIPLLEKKPDRTAWASAVKDFVFYGEKSERCWRCYRVRMESAFQTAAAEKFDIVGTVLSISPHKDSARINSIGRELSEIYRIEFLTADFKKKDGFKKSVALSAEYGFYRQDYCGCIFSKLEREKNSPWYEKEKAFREGMLPGKDQN